MAELLDQVVVVDIEATCWAGAPPPGEEREIIEVGVCLLDPLSLERSEKHSVLVRPQRSRVSDYCTALTTLTAEQVAGGVSFAEACAALVERFDTRRRAWASWGDFDRVLFEAQCVREGVPYPYGPTHHNVKSLYALVHGLPLEIGMMDALKASAIPHEGTHHRGHDDAWNIAGLLARVLAAARAR
jgi:inhibitor of KinA sporulation pathway (predicted exonuclease)